MLATMNPPQDAHYPAHNSHCDSRPDYQAQLADSSGLEDRLCPGCKLSAVSEHGGLVVAFGQSFFHVDCFRCAKCSDKVTADTNLLLLSDGSPVCANCSYSCNICRLPILDEAIMTGDDSFHAHCFKCKICKNRIDDLVFAKTSQGIYCMDCHNERMIKIRKHNEKKAEREKAGGSSSSRDRYRPRENGHSSPAPDGINSKRNANPEGSRNPESLSSLRSPAKRPAGPYISDAFNQPPPYPGQTFHTPQKRGTDSPSYLTSSFSAPPPQTISVTVAPPEPESLPQTVFHPPPRESSVDPPRQRQQTLPILSSNGEQAYPNRSKSFDDGVRPLDVLARQRSVSPEVPPSQVYSGDGGLDAPTSKRNKRRSINPGLVLSNFNAATPPVSPPNLSPLSATFRQQHLNRSPTSPNFSGRESPRAPSPLREREASSSRPPSNSSLHSNSSNFRSLSSSSSHQNLNAPDRDHDTRNRTVSTGAYSHDQSQDQTIVAPPLRASVSEGAPPRMISSSSTDLPGSRDRSSSTHPRMSSERPDGRPAAPQRFSNMSLNIDDGRSSSRSRPGSRADVPHSVESGTDTEPEGDDASHRRTESNSSIPPALPEKDIEYTPQCLDVPSPTSEMDHDLSSNVSHPDSGSDDMSESSPVEQTSHATYIAPALPPIRFSMNTADFSDLFSGVSGGGMSMKNLASISESSRTIREDSENGHGVPLTPPPTASSFLTEDKSSTPTSEVTIIGSAPSSVSHHYSERTLHENESSNEDVRKISIDSQRSFSASSSSIHRVSSDETYADTTQVLTVPTKVYGESPEPGVTVTTPGSNVARSLRQDPPDLVLLRLQEALSDAQERGAQQLKLDRGFVEAIVKAMESRKTDLTTLRGKFDGVKRTSMQYIEGLTVAQTEYDRELKARRDAEAEVTRLRVLLSGQAARLTALSGDSRRQELRQQMSKDLHSNLSGLEHDLSKLKVQRDMALAEVEELAAAKSSPVSPDPPSNLGRSFTVRLDKLKVQYQRELLPLTEQREALAREIQELKGVRDVFLEETTVLNARNEELAQLTNQYARRMETVPETPSKNAGLYAPRVSEDRTRPALTQNPSYSSTTSIDEAADLKYIKIPKPEVDYHTPSKAKFIKWPGSRAKEPAPSPAPSSLGSSESSKPKVYLEHNFQQLSVLRFARCDHCGDKMWGSQLKCTSCNVSVHVRCIHQVQVSCTQQSQTSTPREEASNVPLPPSMFGRDLIEQTHADGSDREVPVIVEKCIDAVETLAMDYEGIYRKSGGSGQTRAITQLFERGDYNAFDLCDSDRFNDICSVTSVLKTYFRTLPNPLLTYDLHDQFMSAVQNRDIATKNKALVDLINRLPNEHYCTLRMLMLHLHGIYERSERNLMTARNLGVVFGPTLMRSSDPGAEFSDMAGKALSVEWLVENAQHVFKQNSSR